MKRSIIIVLLSAALLGCGDPKILDSGNKAFMHLVSGSYDPGSGEILNVEIKKKDKTALFVGDELRTLSNALHAAFISSSDELIKNSTGKTKFIGNLSITTTVGTSNFMLYECPQRPGLYCVRIITPGDIGSGFLFFDQLKLPILQ